MSDVWVVWSKYHGQYWGPERSGYTDNLLYAGAYSEAEAKAIEAGSDREDTAISVASRLTERPGLVHHALLAAAREEGRREQQAAHAAQLVALRGIYARAVCDSCLQGHALSLTSEGAWGHTVPYGDKPGCYHRDCDASQIWNAPGVPPDAGAALARLREEAVREAVRNMRRPMQPAGTDKVIIGGVMVDRGDLLAALTPKGGDRE